MAANVLISAGLSAKDAAQAINTAYTNSGDPSNNDANIDGATTQLNLALFGTFYGMNRKTVTSGNADRTRQVELAGGVPKIAGVGVIKIDLFISAKMAGLGMVFCPALGACYTREPLGNNRGFSPNASLTQSKVALHDLAG